MLPLPPSSAITTRKVVTTKLHDAVLPAISVAVQLTVVTPAGKMDPDGGLHTVITDEQLSLAVGAG
jgi:hypothetical protein